MTQNCTHAQVFPSIAADFNRFAMLERCGELEATDSDLPPSGPARRAPHTFENVPALWVDDLPPPRIIAGRAGRGRALISGSEPPTVPTRLAARAAVAIGAGQLSIAVPGGALVPPGRLPGDATDTSAFEDLIANMDCTGLLIGPGAGSGEATRARALAMLRSTRPTVLDADALSAFLDEPKALFRAIAGPCVFLPHECEFLRLFHVDGDTLSRVRTAARCSGAVIVLRGSHCVIASPDGRVIIDDSAPAEPAPAGADGVLAGLVLGLLAQGMDPFLAAAAAVWMRGAAARASGPALLADDLPDQLAGVLRLLGKQSDAAAVPAEESVEADPSDAQPPQDQSRAAAGMA